MNMQFIVCKSNRTCLKTGLFSAKIQECPGIRWTSGSQPTRKTTSLPDSHSIKEFLQQRYVKSHQVDVNRNILILNDGADEGTRQESRPGQ